MTTETATVTEADRDRAKSAGLHLEDGHPIMLAFAAHRAQSDARLREAASPELVEQVAQFLHDEGGFGDSWNDRTWPEHPDDTGQRESGWVKIVPTDGQAKFRDVARRLLTMPAARAALASLPDEPVAGDCGEVEPWHGHRPETVCEAIANFWAEWEEDRAGSGTYTAEELAEDSGDFATGLFDHLAALASLPDQPCAFCKGTGWVDDQNWSWDYPDLPQERVPGNGLIRCGGLECIALATRPALDPAALEAAAKVAEAYPTSASKPIGQSIAKRIRNLAQEPRA